MEHACYKPWIFIKIYKKDANLQKQFQHFSTTHATKPLRQTDMERQERAEATGAKERPKWNCKIPKRSQLPKKELARELLKAFLATPGELENKNKRWKWKINNWKGDRKR